MKKLLLLLTLSLMLGKINQAQIVYSPNTYYIILPTAGCNGIWAVELPQNCFGGASIISPFGCATVSHVDGDTLFFDLCSIPCEYIVTNDSGNICMMCSLELPSGLSESVDSRENITVVSNPAGNLISVNGAILKGDAFVLVNSLGQEIARKYFDSDTKTNEVKINDLPSGIYFWKVFSMNQVHANGKFIVLK